MNGRRVDVTIGIPRTSLAVRMYNPTKGSEPEQVPPDMDEGAGAGCSGAVLGGQHLEVSVLFSDKRQRPERKLGVARKLHVETPRCHGLPGRILSASHYLARLYQCRVVRYLD
jgi:hypothetical protein